MSQTGTIMNASNLRRTVELFLLFVFLPLLFILEPDRLPKLPCLAAFTLLCLWLLLRDQTFDRKLLWNRDGLDSGFVRGLALKSVLVLVLCTALTLALQPMPQDSMGGLFHFPRSRTGLWLLVMVFYPVLSAYPQEIIYRAFFFHRYQGLFPRVGCMLLFSALSFCWLHAIFDNWLAPALTLPGGWLFAKAYEERKSLLAAGLEHAVYGCIVFSSGLGLYFYEGWKH